jgi:L-cystine transport system permease protein
MEETMNFNVAFMFVALKAAAVKIPLTLTLAVVPLLWGAVFGLAIALVRFFRVRFLAFLFRWVVTTVKGIPVVLLLLVLYVWLAYTYDPLMHALGLPFTFKALDKALIAITALSVYASVALSEAFRGALASVPKGQYDAGYAAGLSTVQLLVRIVLPQALPVSLPVAGNILIMLTKAAALASLVSVVDVMNAAVIAASTNYRFLEAYVAAALIYWALCVIIERVFTALEKMSGATIRAVV